MKITSVSVNLDTIKKNNNMIAIHAKKFAKIVYNFKMNVNVRINYN